MKESEYSSAVSIMRLKECGALFGLPVIFDVTDTTLRGNNVLLKYKGANLAVISAWKIFGSRTNQ